MPNWTYNTVKMRGIAKAPLFDKDKNFEFGRIIAEPQTKEECLKLYGEKYIDNGNCHLEHGDGDEWFNWYDWRCDFWGTKWDACDTIIYDDDTIGFSTAWAEPIPIWEKLSQMYPIEPIQIEAEYEDGWLISSEYLNGEHTYYNKKIVEDVI